jgi:hypothetical protein
LNTNTFGPAQDPTVEPARVTEGIIPMRMNRGDFFVIGETWSKFHLTFPSVTFRKFLDIKLHLYEKRNAAVKKFFTESQRDPVRHADVLADRALRREIRRVQNCSKVSYTLPKGLKRPR